MSWLLCLLSLRAVVSYGKALRLLKSTLASKGSLNKDAPAVLPLACIVSAKFCMGNLEHIPLSHLRFVAPR